MFAYSRPISFSKSGHQKSCTGFNDAESQCVLYCLVYRVSWIMDHHWWASMINFSSSHISSISGVVFRIKPRCYHFAWLIYIFLFYLGDRSRAGSPAPTSISKCIQVTGICILGLIASLFLLPARPHRQLRAGSRLEDQTPHRDSRPESEQRTRTYA